MTKLIMPLFAFFAAGVMHGGCVGAESGKDGEDPTADTESAPDAVTALSSSCPGVRIEHIPMKSGSTTLAFLDIFFDSSTGNNCAMTVAAGSVSGHASAIDVLLVRCTETSPSLTCHFDGSPQVDPNPSDPGPFHFFAGPVSVHAPGHCIFAQGHLTFNGVTVQGFLPGASHCG
jgi:hypothetical protein